MQKIALIGSTGMLGSMIYAVLKDSFKITLVYRDEKHASLLEKKYGNSSNIQKVQFPLESIYQDFKKSFYSASTSPHLKILQEKIGEVDVVINCVGVIKPYIQANEEMAFFLNGFFPHLLSQLYKEQLIHLTTDCVYSGIEGAPYDEDSPKSPNDLYGLSKSLGEPCDASLVLRTSIIGPEVHGFLSLLEWVKNQKGEINGYTNHVWNGITTKEFGVICKKIIEKRKLYPKNGLYHIYSTDVTKYEMVKKIAERYNMDIKVNPKKADIAVDRRLRSIHSLCKDLKIPNFEKMLQEL